jgi:hypothetical protein
MEMKIGGCFSTHSLYIWLKYDGISRSQYTSTWTTPIALKKNLWLVQ